MSRDQLAADAQVDRAYLGALERKTPQSIYSTVSLMPSASRFRGFTGPAPNEMKPSPLPPGREGVSILRLDDQTRYSSSVDPEATLLDQVTAETAVPRAPAGSAAEEARIEFAMIAGASLAR